VLVEVLATFSGQGRALRRAAVRGVDRILADGNTEVLPQSHDSFLSGLALYRNRSDKGYSLADCISMQAMRERAVSEILTRDRHFQQEGFLLLLPG
jgi:predicted nucleic acid-binding protein